MFSHFGGMPRKRLRTFLVFKIIGGNTIAFPSPSFLRQSSARATQVGGSAQCSGRSSGCWGGGARAAGPGGRRAGASGLNQSSRNRALLQQYRYRAGCRDAAFLSGCTPPSSTFHASGWLRATPATDCGFRM